MQLTVVGCSPAWPNAGGAHSGYLVSSGGRAVLLDCGPGVLPRMRVGGSWPEPDAIVITHFHLDHWGDLIPWVWGSLYLTGQGHELRHPDLWVPIGGIARLVEFGTLLGFPDMFERAFTLFEYAPDVTFEAGGCSITPTVVPHYRMNAHALRVTADGRTLAYSGDSGPSSALVSVARDADLFICEATLLEGDLDGEPRGHLSLEEARAAFDESRAKKLLLTHRPSELAVPGDLDLAYDGLVRPV